AVERLGARGWEGIRRWALNRDTAAFQALRRKIETYVDANVTEPFTWLIEMADKRQQLGKSPIPGRGRKLLSSENSFVVVAGQASRFKPIQEAIRRQVRRLHLSPESGGNLVLLPGRLAKYACVYGAQWAYRTALRCNNPEDALGTYCFYRTGGGRQLRILDMKTFNKRRPEKLDLPEGDNRLIFQPRHFDPGRIVDPELQPIVEADTIANIRTFVYGGDVEVKYLGQGKGIRIVEGGRKPVILDSEATFGNVTEDIYHKTWPEAVPDETKKK
ncbi:MAG: hypothetical protein GY842_04775, partial [bacterium]|nr:hypothetical protein [bacterium]